MLPIHDISEALLAALRAEGNAVVTAPTGSGKSTQVPQILLDNGIPETSTILVLQPRRLAARMLAERVAAERDVPLGGEVGFQTRNERAMSAATRIRFVTDGILLRMLLGDPGLPGVGAVLFDEFHERSLAGDVALAAVYRLQQTRRPDLKIVVMSATLVAAPVAEYLGLCPALHAEGRVFPVELHYLAKPVKTAVWDAAAAALKDLLLSNAPGDVLIFMPGAYEIWRTLEACRPLSSTESLALLPLHGSLASAAQRAAVAPAAARKVIVATNIAETSLTIPGVRHVIDSGQARITRYDTGRGFNMLVQEPISRASADQRAGRAGREAPGTCRRLWTLAEQHGKPAATDPEVRRVELAEIVLLLKSIGYSEAARFTWFEAPHPEALASAEQLLQRLGAVGRGNGKLTALGREMAELPMHPRLARLLLDADRSGCFQEATMIAAILSERPVALGGRAAGKTRRQAARDTGSARQKHSDSARDGLESDFFFLFDALEQARRARYASGICTALGLSANAARQVWETYDFFLRTCRRRGLAEHLSQETRTDREALLKGLLRAFPDHLARRRDRGSLMCDLGDGRRAELARDSSVRDATLLLAGEVRDIPRPGKPATPILSLVSAVREEWLRECFPDDWSESDGLEWDDARRRVIRRRTVSCLGVVLEDHVLSDMDRNAASAMLAARIAGGGLKLNGWTRDVDAWLARVRWVAAECPERGLLEYEEADIAVVLNEFCAGAVAYSEVKNKPLLDTVRHALSWDDQQFVERMAPASVQLPCGHRMRIDYQPGQPPKGRARIQDLYDLKENPRVAGGRTPILLEILAPNMRTVQITADLAGFWRDAYPRAKKELARRYPKHEWR